MWNLYRKAETFSTLPAELLGLENPWVRWQFDNAVLHLGTVVTHRMGEEDRRGKPRYPTVEQALGLMPAPKPVNVAALATFAKVSKG